MTPAPAASAAPNVPAPACREGRARHDGAERGARWVLAISVVTMVAEIVAGRVTGSLALYADGWHMATHAGALASTVLALWFARRYREARSFSFGTGKVHALAGWTSALVLVGVALWMMVEAALRIEQILRGDAQIIDFTGALVVAVIGLVINLGSVLVLGQHDGHAHAHGGHADHEHARTHGEHDHGHAHGEHGHAHGEHDDDHDHAHGEHAHGEHRHPPAHAKASSATPDAASLRSSGIESMVVHLLADALTSALAIGALLGGRFLGWSFLDPLVAASGGLVVLRWAMGLLTRTGKELLDATPSTADEEKLRRALEGEGDARVLDLHLWDQGPGHRFAIVSLEVKSARELADFRAVAQAAVAIDHLTIEIGRAPTLASAGRLRD